MNDDEHEHERTDRFASRGMAVPQLREEMEGSTRRLRQDAAAS
jgi:hypothetical protein